MTRWSFWWAPSPTTCASPTSRRFAFCALRFTETARAHICKAGGEFITFFQLTQCGANTLLLRGPKNARDSVKHFGASGVPNSRTNSTVETLVVLFTVKSHSNKLFLLENKKK
eukprot:822242_1